VSPRGAFISLADGITDIFVLTKWLELANQPLESGVYTLSYLADDDFDLPIVAVTYYGDGRWGTSRIDTTQDSPFAGAPFTSEDKSLFIEHVATRIPERTTVVSLGATEDDCLPFGYQGGTGLLLRFESDSCVLATLDIYWEVNNQSCQVLWELPYIAGNLTPFRDESIIVPTITEALEMIANIKKVLDMPIKMDTFTQS
jgi:hypothetical protein